MTKSQHGGPARTPIDTAELERLADTSLCPFCGRDPYHYVDIGVGMDRAAVDCCDLGIGLFQYGDDQLSKVSGLLSILAREVLAHRKAEAWQPIETAPHETLVVLGWYEGDVWKQEIALASAGTRYSNGYSDLWQHGRASHWRPLPTPPTTPEAEGGCDSAPELKRCPACNGRGYHHCDCWPGDCICGFGDEECDDCRGEGWIDPSYDDFDGGSDAE